MFDLTNVNETVYFLPEDGDAAREQWLELLAMPTEGWILGYGFTMPEAFAKIAEHEAAGIPTHLLLDYTQSRGPAALALIKELATQIKVGSLTLTTAGIGSKHTSQIFHTKGMVKRTLDGKGYICWDGSVNFSDSGWLQANIARKFLSDVYASHFIDQYERHRTWARENLPQYQVSALSGDPVTDYFASITIDKVLADLRDKLGDLDLNLIDPSDEEARAIGTKHGIAIGKLLLSSAKCKTLEDLYVVNSLVQDTLVYGISWLAILESVVVGDSDITSIMGAQ